MKSPRHQSAGFTLVEMILAVGVMAVLMGGMASAILVASRALPDGTVAPNDRAVGVETVEQISRDLALATEFVLADPDAVRFEVPDRGHGAAGPETMRYAWSGTRGDPLTHRYNGCPDITLVEDVHAFSLFYVRKALTLPNPPRVLLVVDDAASPLADEIERQDLMESWGFSVEMITAASSAATYAARLPSIDVIYISQTVWSDDLEGRDLNLDTGIVTEEGWLYDEMGISSAVHADLGNDVFWVADNTHEITAGLSLGPVPIFEYFMRHVYSIGTVAPGARVLSQWPGFDPTTVVIDAGGELWDGGRARSRRVGLVWGFNDFDIDGLSDIGRRIMRRSIVWAAALVCIGAVKITLQVGPDASGRAETLVQLLNVPEAP